MTGAIDLQGILRKINALEELAGSGADITNMLHKVRTALDGWYKVVGDYKTYYALVGRIDRRRTQT